MQWYISIFKIRGPLCLKFSSILMNNAIIDCEYVNHKFIYDIYILNIRAAHDCNVILQKINLFEQILCTSCYDLSEVTALC
jgi:hypothetical protein